MFFNALSFRETLHFAKLIIIYGLVFFRLATLVKLELGPKLLGAITVLISLLEELVMTAIAAILSAIVSISLVAAWLAFVI